MALSEKQQETLANFADALEASGLDGAAALGSFLDAAKPAVERATMQRMIDDKRRDLEAARAASREDETARLAEIDALTRQLGA